MWPKKLPSIRYDKLNCVPTFLLVVMLSAHSNNFLIVKYEPSRNLNSTKAYIFTSTINQFQQTRSSMNESSSQKLPNFRQTNIFPTQNLWKVKWGLICKDMLQKDLPARLFLRLTRSFLASHDFRTSHINKQKHKIRFVFHQKIFV